MASILLLAWIGLGPPIDGDTNPLTMTPAVACKRVDGRGDFSELPGASLTADEKLLVYYEPSGFATRPEGAEHIARFTQSGKIRRKGSTAVVWSKADILDYTARGRRPPEGVYLMNTISLKGLKPGSYEFELRLKDEVGGHTASQVLPFRIAPTAAPPPG